jgi:hypothetical protein
MENISGFHKHIDDLHYRVQALSHAEEGLQQAFNEQADRLCRHDQARCLDDLRKKVEREIIYADYRETSASLAFTNSKIEASLFNFVGGTLAGLFLPLKEHPLKMGARLAVEASARTSPFHTIMVGVGANGVPDDVHVFSISEYARKWCTSEVEVEAELKARGYRMFTQKDFFDLLDKLKHRVLAGTFRLPALKSGTVVKLVRRKSEPIELIPKGDSQSNFDNT